MFHEYTSTSADKIFYVNNYVWAAMSIYSSTKATLISQDRKKVCEFNIQTYTLSKNCYTTNSSEPYIYSNYSEFIYLTYWVFCTNTTLRY